MKVSAQSNNNKNGKKTIGKKCTKNGSIKTKGAKQLAAKKKTIVKKKSITKTNKTTSVKNKLKKASRGRKRTCSGKLMVQIEGLTKPQRRGEKGTTEVVETTDQADETTTSPEPEEVEEGYGYAYFCS